MSLMVGVSWIVINKYPMCWKTIRILFIDAPKHRMAKLTNRFPAGNFPSMYGWLVHENDSLHWLQVDVMVNIVPD